MSLTGQPRRSAAEIEAEIARTRAELGHTADALARRLDTRHLFTRGLDMIAEAVGGSSDFRLGEALRANAVPLALVGLGVGWLLAGNTGVIDAVAEDERVQAARRRIAEVAGQVGDRVGITGNPQIDTASGERRGNGWVHQAADAARSAARTVRETAEQAGERVHLAEPASRAMARHPLLIGALGVLAGAVLATLVPPTRVEEEWLGDTRDNLREGARAIARDTVERVRGIAENAGR